MSPWLLAEHLSQDEGVVRVRGGGGLGHQPVPGHVLGPGGGAAEAAAVQGHGALRHVELEDVAVWWSKQMIFFVYDKFFYV